ncbi:MAG: amino acid transporter permease, partial [Frankiales bacterium]|nr:amino acid transporter permease [Frankiales bacterium]
VVAVPYSFDLYAVARDIGTPIFDPVPLLLVASTWYLAITSVLMVGQFYLERYFARGSSRKLSGRQLQALADAQTVPMSEAR